jgi:nitrite reductase/ring-hydroxylating ferredoxin subunit
MNDPSFQPVVRLDELTDGRARYLEIAGHAIALYRSGDSAAALAARCPHAGGSMVHGWIEDDEAVCPLHRWRFRLDDGRCTSVRDEHVRIYGCIVQDGMVYVQAGSDHEPVEPS